MTTANTSPSPEDQTLKISGVINTRNAEAHLDAVLRAMSNICDELIVGDMDSSDSTLEIAQRYGATVLHLGNLGFPEAGIPAILQAATHEWILRLDADEVLTAPLGRLLVELATNDVADVVRIPIRTWMLGRPIDHGSFGPENSSHPRFFKRGFIQHVDRIHGVHVIAPHARVLRISDIPGWFEEGRYVEHLSYRGTVDMRLKAVRYTTNEAEQAAHKDLLKLALQAVVKIPYEFFGRFVHRAGYRDRLLAMMVSANCALYQAERAMRMVQFRFFGTDQEIEQTNHSIADAAVRSWENAKWQ